MTLVWVLVLTVGGCGPKKEETGDAAGTGERPAGITEERSEPESHGDQELAEIPGSEQRGLVLPLQREYEHLDAGKVGWDTEVFGETAKARLKKVVAGLAGSGPITAGSLRELVSAEFRGSVLRPELEEVFRDGSLTVWRAKSGPENEAKTVEGVEGLAAALEALAEPLRGAEWVRKETKVFTVEPQESGEVVTKVYFHAIARTGGSTLQQNATWQCRWKGNFEDPRLVKIEIADYEETRATTGTGALFADCTEAVFAGEASYRDHLRYGIDHWRHRMDVQLAPFIAGYNGVAVGDLNGDGREDVYVCQDRGLPNRLLIQNADGTVSDQTEAKGVGFLDPSTSALILDFDNDGDQDLAVGSDGGVTCLENDGTGKLTVRTVIPFPTYVFSLAAADYDGDGLLDIYICGHTGSDEEQRESVLGIPVPVYDANNGQPNMLVRNEGGWKFRDVTAETGLEENNRRFSFAAVWEDFDNDGDLDLAVANDFGRNNLYHNEGKGAGGVVRFRDVAPVAGVEDISSGMSVSSADYDHDGRMDLYFGNMFSSAGNRVAYQRKFRPGSDAAELGAIRRMARGNSLFQNAGGTELAFRDVSVESGVTMGRWAWASKFVDLNNDSWEDLVVANGFFTGAIADDL